MEKLPCEILDKILSVNYIGIKDLFNLSSTCRNLRDTIIQNSYIWKEKYKKRWPNLYYLRQSEVSDWCEELRQMFRLRQKAYNLVLNMSEDYYPDRDLSNQELKDWGSLVDTSTDYLYTFQFLLELMDENQLKGDIDSAAFMTPGNLTLRYYVFKILYFILTQKLEVRWKNVLSKPLHFRTLEEVSTILAQRFQCDTMIIPEVISEELDILAHDVMDYLRDILPDHPLFSIPEDTLESWKGRKFKHQQYNADDSMMVLQAIVYVLWNQKRFRKATVEYFHCDNFNINTVLQTKRGSAITISIIYQSVARRLGIYLEPVMRHSIFLLHYVHETNYLIDIFRGNITDTEDLCQIIDIKMVVDMILRSLDVGIIKNQHRKYGSLLKRSILEWKLTVDPENVDALMDLAYTYGNLGISKSKLHPYFLPLDHNDLQQIITNCSSRYQDAFSSKYIHTPEVRENRKSKFAIGMIMRLSLCGSLCVICDWEPSCKNLESWSFYLAETGHISNQPNYTVLFDDGSCYKMPECFLDVTTRPRRITHPDLGIHFTHFCKTHYVPNELKERLYPEDRQVRADYHQKILTGNLPDVENL